MFGKPEWFKAKTWGWGLHPVTWQGWAWLAVWLGVMLLPYVAFLASQMWTEGFIWLGAMLGALVLDVWQILALMRPSVAAEIPTQRFTPKARPAAPPAEVPASTANDGIVFLGEPVATGRGAKTKNYDFHMRNG